jgi:hypothetical protein
LISEERIMSQDGNRRILPPLSINSETMCRPEKKVQLCALSRDQPKKASCTLTREVWPWKVATM